jgi:tRNA A-37 threonylcarbamoyl transferase component Bud32
LDLLRALAYCHERGIVHKNLKPDNIMIDKPESRPGQPSIPPTAKIIDFFQGALGNPGDKAKWDPKNPKSQK